ncbi:MAG: YceI family protein, partial [Fusobacteriaceae bacterium]
MKKNLIFMFAVVTIFTSCKNEKTDNDAKTVVENTEATTTFVIDTTASVVEWVGSKPAGKHTGILKISKGNFSVNGSKIVNGNATLNMNSITVTDLTGDDKLYLEGHLKGTTDDKEKNDHFFDVTQHPTAKFEVTTFHEKDGKTILEGNLIIKGITKSVSIPVIIAKKEGVLTINSDKFSINRTEWNINYSS